MTMSTLLESDSFLLLLDTASIAFFHPSTVQNRVDYFGSVGHGEGQREEIGGANEELEEKKERESRPNTLILTFHRVGHHLVSDNLSSAIQLLEELGNSLLLLGWREKSEHTVFLGDLEELQEREDARKNKK